MKIICNNAGKTDHCHVCSHGHPHEHRKWKACYMNVECPILKEKVHCVTVKEITDEEYSSLIKNLYPKDNSKKFKKK